MTDCPSRYTDTRKSKTDLQLKTATKWRTCDFYICSSNTSTTTLLLWLFALFVTEQLQNKKVLYIFLLAKSLIQSILDSLWLFTRIKSSDIRALQGYNTLTTSGNMTNSDLLLCHQPVWVTAVSNLVILTVAGRWIFAVQLDYRCDVTWVILNTSSTLYHAL